MSDEEFPHFDEAIARELVGKTILVGLTVEDRRGQFKGYEQFWGKVESASRAGTVLVLQGSRSGERQTIPPANTWYKRAERGTYRLRSTGEEVVDPDYLLTAQLVRPDA
jgi:hypothetical protein